MLLLLQSIKSSLAIVERVVEARKRGLDLVLGQSSFTALSTACDQTRVPVGDDELDELYLRD